MPEMGPPTMCEYKLLSRLIARGSCWLTRRGYWRIAPSLVSGGRSRSVARRTVQRLIARGWANSRYVSHTRTAYLEVTDVGRTVFEAIEPSNRPVAWSDTP